MTPARPRLLVERDPQLARLGEAIGQVANGHGGCLCLVGEAGSGKTRLLLEAREMARRQGLTVLAASPPAVTTPPAFGLIAQALRSWTRVHPEPHQDLSRFALGIHQVLPEWELPSGAAALAPHQMRLLVLEGALQLLLKASAPMGGLLVLDDLHGSDPESIEFLHYAAAAVPDEQLLLLAAVRCPEGDKVAAGARTLEGRGLASVLEVPPLSQVATAALIEALLGGPPPLAMVSEIWSWTGGIPLLVEQVVEANLAVGTIRRERGELLWAAGGYAVVPRTTQEIVRQQLARLPAEARPIVSAAAILDSFDPRLLAAVAEADQGAVVASLRCAREGGLVETAGATTVFRHGLVREALVQVLLPAERTGLHRRAAQAMEELFGDDAGWLERRAHHLEALGDRRSAAELLVQAARRSLQTHGPLTAEGLLRRAQRLAPEGAVGQQVSDGLAEALGDLGRWEEALGVDAVLLEAAGEQPDRLERMARHAARSGRLDHAEQLVARATAAGGDPRRLARLSALVALWRGDLEGAVVHGQRALAVGEAEGDPKVICEALDVIGRGNDYLGRRPEALVAFRRWEQVAEEAGLTMSRLQALMEHGNVDFMEGGDPARLRRAKELATETGAFVTLVLADLSLAAFYLPGEPREGVRLADEAVGLCRRFGLDLLPHALVAAAYGRARLRHETGEPLLAEALALVCDDDVLICVADTRVDLALRSGHPHLALEHGMSALERLKTCASGVPSISSVLVPYALAWMGRPDEGRAALEEAGRSAYVARMPHWGTPHLRAAEAMLAKSEASFEDALAAFPDTMGYERAEVLTIGAEVIGGPAAEVWLRRALTTFLDRGAEDDAARARQRLRFIGAPVPRARHRGSLLPQALRDKGITEREANVIELLGQGLSNADISARLFLSVRTVEGHVSSLLSKTGADNRTALVAWYLDIG